MVKRHNSQTKKPFWGCVKWTSKDPMSCSGTANYIAPPEGMLADGGDRELNRPSNVSEATKRMKAEPQSHKIHETSDDEKVFYNFQEASEYAKQLAMSGRKPPPKLEKIDNNTWVVK